MFNNVFILYILIIPFISMMLYIINYFISPSASSFILDKINPFECGFDSFKQGRMTYSIQFMLIAILFLPFDLELTSILPFILSFYYTQIWGLFIFFLFLIPLIFAFMLELNLKSIFIRSLFSRNDFRNKNIFFY